MRFTLAISSLMALALAGVRVPVYNNVTTLESLGGYEIVSSTEWTGVAMKGGPELTLNGTIEEVDAQIKQIYSHYSSQDSRYLEEGLSETPQLSDNIICNPSGFDRINDSIVRMGAKYLQDRGGDCTAPAGPKKCTRISCKTRGGIFLCNDTPVEIRKPCHHLGDMAIETINKCVGGDDLICGQEFDPAEGYSVIVALSDC